jgi:hypothetical protein
MNTFPKRILITAMLLMMPFYSGAKTECPEPDLEFPAGSGNMLPGCFALGLGANDPIKLASFLDNTTYLPSPPNPAGSTAVSAAFGIDNRRALEVAHIFRPEALGHPIEFVGPDRLADLPNYRENCNNSDPNLSTNETTANGIIADTRIIAVLGLVCSNSGLQAAPVFTAGKVPVVSVANLSPALTKGLSTPSGGVTTASGKLNCNNKNPKVGSNFGDCSPGAGYFTVDTISCPPISGAGTCNFINQPLP